MAKETPRGNAPHPVERMMKWFTTDNLEEKPQLVAAAYHELARRICTKISPGPERTVALRHLLSSRDAAIRATLVPGG